MGRVSSRELILAAVFDADGAVLVFFRQDAMTDKVRSDVDGSSSNADKTRRALNWN